MNFKKVLKYAVVSLFMGLSFCQPLKVEAISQDSINNFRVRVHYTTAPSVGIRAYSGYSWFVDGVALGNIISDGQEFTITANGNTLDIKDINGVLLKTGSIFELRKNDTQLRYFEIKGIDGLDFSKYPDNLTIKRSSDLSNIYCINSTNIETYLKGVLPYEMGSASPLEALKAQAVAARTYAVTHVGGYSYEGFDVRNDVYDQVYKGYSTSYFSSSSNIYKAVEGTRGVVLKYGSSLVSGQYYSTNGGYTADSSIVWGFSSPYYKFKQDSYDTYAHPSTAGWAKITYSTSYTRSALATQLRGKGYNVTDNFNLKINDSRYGYVVTESLTDDQGHSYTIKNTANRSAFGLRSQRFSVARSGGLYAKGVDGVSRKDAVSVKDVSGSVTLKCRDVLNVKNASSVSVPNEETFTFNGAGYGHGVGMSQNGAMNRASAGNTFQQILSFYYDGCATSANYGN